jgi:hypothetical protein
MGHKKMADSKIDFSFENLHFSCEGDNLWVERQLNNVLSRIPALLAVHKKGEGIVEEVIDIEGESMNVVADNTTHVRGAKTVKSSPKSSGLKKAKGTKVGKKEKTVKSKPVQGKKIVEPTIGIEDNVELSLDKIKENKTSKAKSAVSKTKRGRKPSAKKLVVKSREPKKVSEKGKPLAELIDSPLARFLVEKNADKNQVRKFMATAVFLSRNNNVTMLSTPMISKALKSYGIVKLQNASDCLNKNEKKGNCIKTGKEFTITEAGFQTF